MRVEKTLSRTNPGRFIVSANIKQDIPNKVTVHSDSIQFNSKLYISYRFDSSSAEKSWASVELQLFS